MPERLVARLAAELDSVRPRHPRVAQARYRGPRAVSSDALPLAGLAAAGALAALALGALATVATGSPNPEVWTGTFAGQLHRMQEPTPPIAASPPVIEAPTPLPPAPTHAATPPPKAPERPQPTATPHEGRGEHPEQRPSPSPGGRDGHQMGTSDSSPSGR